MKVEIKLTSQTVQGKEGWRLGSSLRLCLCLELEPSASTFISLVPQWAEKNFLGASDFQAEREREKLWRNDFIFMKSFPLTSLLLALKYLRTRECRDLLWRRDALWKDNHGKPRENEADIEIESDCLRPNSLKGLKCYEWKLTRQSWIWSFFFFFHQSDSSPKT